MTNKCPRFIDHVASELQVNLLLFDLFFFQLLLLLFIGEGVGVFILLLFSKFFGIFFWVGVC